MDFNKIFTDVTTDELEEQSTVVLEDEITIVADAYQLVKLIPSSMVKGGLRKEVLNTRKITDARLGTAIANQLIKQARSLGANYGVVAKDVNGKDEKIIFKTQN